MISRKRRGVVAVDAVARREGSLAPPPKKACTEKQSQPSRKTTQRNVDAISRARGGTASMIMSKGGCDPKDLLSSKKALQIRSRSLAKMEGDLMLQIMWNKFPIFK